MKPIGFDCETHRISEGNPCPRLICLSIYRGFRATLHGRNDATVVVRPLLEDEQVHFIGHVPFFDFGVLVNEDPSLLPLVERAFSQGRVHCTRVREQLIRIETNDSLRKLSLADLVLVYFGQDISQSKSAGSWRLNYHILDGLSVDEWPIEAREYAMDDAMWASKLFDAQKELSDFPDEQMQTHAAWALHLMRLWGIRVDANAVNTLKGIIREKVVQADKTASVLGFLKKDGTKDMGVLKGLVSEAYNGDPPTTLKGNIQTSSEVLKNSRSEELRVYAEGSNARKLLSTYIPFLEKSEYPIHAYFNTLVRSGRTSSSRPNLQNLPRAAGVRECFIPREGNVFSSIDFDTIELRALAQIHLNWFGKSALADAFREGEDPHLLFAARLLGVSYAEAERRRREPEIKEMRSLAKIANFGYAGGLGASFVSYAQGYGVSLGETEKEAQMEAACLKREWFRHWKEMRRYFSQIAIMTRSGDTVVTQEFSGRKRGGCSFTASANTLFQGLTADGCKLALIGVYQACYLNKGSPCFGVRPLIFLHDEILAEGPKETAHLWAPELARIMVAEMQKVMPDIPVTASPVLMERWYKDAEPEYDSSGRLIPWEPQNQDTNLLYALTN